MDKSSQVNTVALLLPGVMEAVCDIFDEAIGKGEHNVVLVVGAGDVSQYIANRDRALSVELLSGLLARWNVGLPDTLPGEHTPGDTRPFEYLLNEFERHAHDQAGQRYADTRAELVGYVGRLIALQSRKDPQP